MGWPFRRKRIFWRLVYCNPGAMGYRNLNYPQSEWRKSNFDPYFASFLERARLPLEPPFSHYEPEYCPPHLRWESCEARQCPEAAEQLRIERKL